MGPVVDHGRRRSPASQPLQWGNSCHKLEKRGRGPGGKQSPPLEFYNGRWFQKKNRGRGVDGALFRCGREGGADNALFNSLHTWEGSAWHDSTAEREGGGGSASG
jgi:hypothetical protein